MTAVLELYRRGSLLSCLTVSWLIDWTVTWNKSLIILSFVAGGTGAWYARVLQQWWSIRRASKQTYRSRVCRTIRRWSSEGQCEQNKAEPFERVYSEDYKLHIGSKFQESIRRSSCGTYDQFWDRHVLGWFLFLEYFMFDYRYVPQAANQGCKMQQFTSESLELFHKRRERYRKFWCWKIFQWVLGCYSGRLEFPKHLTGSQSRLNFKIAKHN